MKTTPLKDYEEDFIASEGGLAEDGKQVNRATMIGKIHSRETRQTISKRQPALPLRVGQNRGC